jgi:hypothetical protein
VSSGTDEGGKIKYQKAKSKIAMQNAIVFWKAIVIIGLKIEVKI